MAATKLAKAIGLAMAAFALCARPLHAAHVAISWTPPSSSYDSYKLYYATYSFYEDGAWISTMTAAADPNIQTELLSSSMSTVCYDSLSLTADATYYLHTTALLSGVESGFDQTSGGGNEEASVFIDTGLYVNLNATDTVRLVLNPANSNQALLSLQMYDPAFPSGSFSATVGMPSGNKSLSFTQFVSTPSIYYTTVASTTFQWSDYNSLSGAVVPVTAGGQTYHALGEGDTFDAALGGVVQDSSECAQVLISSVNIVSDARVTVSSEPADIGGIRAAALASQNLASLGSGRSLIMSSCASASTATLTLPFSSSSIPSGSAISNVTIAYFNPNTVAWELQSGTVVNAASGTVSAKITHFAIDPTFTAYYAIYQPVVSVDTASPAIVIAAPANDSAVSKTITITGTASDSVGVSSVAVSIDGGSYSLATGTRSWTSSLNTTTLLNGAHSITAKAWDSLGLTSTATVSITVANPPAIAITAPVSGSTVSAVSSISGTASDSVLVSSVAVSVNGGAYVVATGTSSWTYSLNTSTIPNGLRSVIAKAWDSVGACSTATITLDFANPPTLAITFPANNADVARTVTISGTAQGSLLVSSVAVSIDGGSYSLATGTAAWTYSLNTLPLTSSTHSITARAWDNFDDTAAAAAIVMVDNVPPTLGVAFPSNGAIVSGGILVEGTANDNVLVSSVAVKVDNGAFSVASGTGSWTSNLNTTLLTNASHALTIQAWDEAGNTTVSSVTITVHNAPPLVSIASPKNGAIVYGTIALSGTASDAITISSVAISVDGGAFSLATGTASWTYSLNTTGSTNANHYITAKVWDIAGSTGTYILSLTVDNNPPAVAIANPPNGSAVAGVASVAGAASDSLGVSSVAVSMDGGGYVLATGTGPWTYSLNTTTLSGGAHALTAKVWNLAGNTAVSSVDVLVDNVPPTLAISTPLAGATISGTFAVSGTADDNVLVSSVAISIDGDAYSLATGTADWSYSLNTALLLNSPHTLTAETWDEAGNTASVSRSFTVNNITTYTYVQLAWSPSNTGQAVVSVQSNDPNFPTGSALSATIGFPSGNRLTSLTQYTPTGSVLQYYAMPSASNFESTDFFYSSAAMTTSVTIGGRTFNALFLPREITPALGGVVLEASGPSEVAIQPGQITQNAQVTISAAPEGAQSSYLAASGMGYLGAGRSIEFVSAGTLTSAALTLPYDPAQFPAGIEVSEARIAYFDAANNSWQAVSNVTPNEANDTLTADVTHFSIYAPAYLTPQSAPGLNAAIVYPDPAVTPHDPVIRVCPGIVNSLDVTIFDVSGRVVNSSTQFNGPMIPSQGVGAGQYCYEYTWSANKSSGVYFAVVNAHPASGDMVKIRLKFAVIR